MYQFSLLITGLSFGYEYKNIKNIFLLRMNKVTFFLRKKSNEVLKVEKKL